jgi:UDP-N-acetylmuramyl pentapeptide phosphotransferase/UDP-N-acetylglucosamine-1-phosphate transferase
VAQFIAVILLFIDLGVMAWPYWWIIILALIVCVGIINAYNFMDGINGITGGYSIAVLIPLIILNNQHAFIEPSYLIVTTIACAIFCFFNFRPKGKARCFAGDIGSIGIAFILMLPITKLILHTGDITYILFLAIYGVDSILTICHRIMLREHLGQAHRKHAFQIMTNELHIPHEIVASAYSIAQLALSIGFIYWSNTHWLYLVTSIAILSIAYVLFMRKYYHLHETYLKQ